MTMSRSDYEVIAKILKDEKVPAKTCQRLANLFSDKNSRFNYEKFMDACGHGIRKPKIVKRVKAFDQDKNLEPQVVEASFLNG